MTKRLIGIIMIAILFLAIETIIAIHLGFFVSLGLWAFAIFLTGWVLCAVMLIEKGKKK